MPGLIRQLGDRKIDVLIQDAATTEAPVVRIALETGVVLCVFTACISL